MLLKIVSGDRDGTLRREKHLCGGNLDRPRQPAGGGHRDARGHGPGCRTAIRLRPARRRPKL